jgi:protocatechuate 3,4-dioxygenase beta subunit
MSRHDDDTIGHVLTRREILASLGIAAGAAALPRELRAGLSALRSGLPACIVRPAQTEGPYFVDVGLDRSDIRPDPGTGKLSEGVPLELVFRVSRMNGSSCAPFPGVLVDVWQCDAVGVYSGVRDINGKFDTTDQKFLRGHQRTGPDGTASFRTIYPGWYQGRTIHIHFKLRTDPSGSRGREFVSQLYFDDKLGDQVAALEPYSGNRDRRTINRMDRIFAEGGGRDLLLDLGIEGKGYRGVFDVGLVMD